MSSEEHRQRKGHVLGCICLFLVVSAAFVAGVFVSDDLRSTLGNWVLKPDEIAPDSPSNPYDIRIIVRRRKDGKLEVFVKDMKTDRARRLDSDLRAGTQELLAAQKNAILQELPEKARSLVKAAFEKLKRSGYKKILQEKKALKNARKQEKPAPNKPVAGDRKEKPANP